MPTGTLSVQLYSVRESLAQDQAAALARLAGVGLRWVEPCGLGAADPAETAASLRAAQQLRRDMDAAGVRASSAHATFPRDLDALAEELETVGAERVFLPVPAAAPDTALEAFSQSDSLDRLADYLTAAADQLAQRGIQVGYHNHWWEWDDVDGAVAYERFLQRAGDQVVVELDAYWSLQGGQDPAALARQLGERAVALHVKSGPARSGPLSIEAALQLDQVPLTQGALPYAELLSTSSARWHVLEVDHSTTDVYELLAGNARTLVDAGLSSFEGPR